MPSLKHAWCREYVLWNQHSFFCLLPCIGDHKKVESEVQGATGGVEEDPVLLTEGEDGKCLGDYNIIVDRNKGHLLWFKVSKENRRQNHC